MTKETINKCDRREKNFGKGKKKIEIEIIENKKQRSVAFSKRRMGLFKKAVKYHQTSGSKIAAIAFSPAGNLYTNDGGGTSVDAIVDNYLSLAGLGSMINGYDDDSSNSDAAKLTEWILDEMMMDGEGNCTKDDYLEIKAALEKLKAEVDNRLTC